MRANLAIVLLSACSSSTVTPKSSNYAEACQPPIVQVSGECALKADGELWCWGFHPGDGTNWSTTPHRIATHVSKMADSNGVGCAIKYDGSLWCWGPNRIGQIGVGTREDVLFPTPLSQFNNVVALAPGPRGVCVITSDHTLSCSGGDVGVETHPGGGPYDSLLLANVTSLGNDVEQVANGWGVTCARKTNGSVWCWGNNAAGGVPGGPPSVHLPMHIAGLPPVIDVVVGSANWAREQNGTVWGWGAGALGDGEWRTTSTPPRRIDALANVVEIVTTGYGTCARKADGTVWCWGENGTIGALSPVRVQAAGNNVRQLAVSQEVACAIRGDGAEWCWGSNRYRWMDEGAVTIRVPGVCR